LLESLKRWTTVVADTGDIEAIAEHKPQDATTNPSLLLQAATKPQFQDLVDEALDFALHSPGGDAAHTQVFMDKLFVIFGCDILKIVPGRVSTSNSRRRTVLDLGQPAESNWGGVTADLLAERESGEGGEFADRSERTHASLSLATNYSSAQRIAAIKSLTCGKTLL